MPDFIDNFFAFYRIALTRVPVLPYLIFNFIVRVSLLDSSLYDLTHILTHTHPQPVTHASPLIT